MRMHGLSRDGADGNTTPDDGENITKQLGFTTPGGVSHVIMPPFIVLDAVSILRASQHEAAVPGAGLSSPIRPLQGPICTRCYKKQNGQAQLANAPPTVHEASLHPFHYDEAAASSSTSTDDTCMGAASSSSDSTTSATTTTSNFEASHIDLLESVRAMAITQTVYTQCACSDGTNTPCQNTYTTIVSKDPTTTTTTTTTTTQDPSSSSSSSSSPTETPTENVSVIYGHVKTHPEQQQQQQQQPGSGSSEAAPALLCDAVYQICVVDTRYHTLCSLDTTGKIKRGVTGQHHYIDMSRACAAAPVVVTAVPVAAVAATATIHAPHHNHRTAPVPAIATHLSFGLVPAVPLVPRPQTSCFVCSTLLDECDEDRRTSSASNGIITTTTVANTTATTTTATTKHRPNRHTNVYLRTHYNWAHKDCVVPCERSVRGVCVGPCPRLNTFVSTMFDGSPRFENVCRKCAEFDDAPQAPAFVKDFSSPAFSSSASSNAFVPDIPFAPPRMQPASLVAMKPTPPCSPTHTQPTAAALYDNPMSPTRKHTTTKRAQPTDWLSTEATIRKKAAKNAAMRNLTSKERAAAQASTFTFSDDKSGVYTDKKHGTWYCLDVNGENPTPVCGMAFSDPYFKEQRVWDTLEQRKQAISEHQRLG
jgi:hypothetical protein